MTRVVFNRESKNKKTGPIPTCTVEKSTCPNSCELKGNGCYANSGIMRYWWDQVDGDGILWDDFCEEVRNLPDGQLWRYAVAGDLPGEGETINIQEFMHLVSSNMGKRGFTFTHKPLTEKNRQSISIANSNGFTINLSAWDAAEADRVMAEGIAPVVCMIPWGTPALSETPGGIPIVACHAQVHKDRNCNNCRLCAKPNRNFIIGFYPHGAGRANGGRGVNERLAK